MLLIGLKLVVYYVDLLILIKDYYFKPKYSYYSILKFSQKLKITPKKIAINIPKQQ